jgi:hypothetical protein
MLLCILTLLKSLAATGKPAEAFSGLDPGIFMNHLRALATAFMENPGLPFP